MNKLLPLLLLICFLMCSQKKDSNEIKWNSLPPRSQISSEIIEFSKKLEALANPEIQLVTPLFQSITIRCRFESSIQGEFMGYPQYLYTDPLQICVWNQYKEIISYEKMELNKTLSFRSYWYLGLPTLIEKKIDEKHSILVNWKWIQSFYISKPTIQRIFIQYTKENKNIEYKFNRYSGSLESKDEWIEIKSKKELNSWQFKYSDTGSPDCTYFEKGIQKSSKKECSLWDTALENKSLFSID